MATIAKSSIANKFETLQPGQVLSETSYYTVEEVHDNYAEVVDSLGHSITLSEEYINQILSSAHWYNDQKKVTRTQMTELLLNNARIAMTVAYTKQDTPLSKREYNARVQAQVNGVTSLVGKKNFSEKLTEAIENPVLPYEKGEYREMVGYHYGEMNSFGRLMFKDLEDKKASGLKQVDPRTIQWIRVNGVKYTLK
jgi:hypothetical protein